MILILSGCRNFVQENRGLVLEVCTLNELGYPLALTQRELTITQKSFLFTAYPLFREMQRESETNNKNNNDTSYSERKAWEEKYKAMQKQNAKD